MVFFYDKNHSYFNLWGEKYESVSGLIDSFEEDFNDDFIALRCAFRVTNELLYTKAKNFVHYGDPSIIDVMKSYVSEEEYNDILVLSEDLKAGWNDYNKERREYGTGIHSSFEEEDTVRGYKINPFDGLKYKVIPRQGSDTYDNSFYIPEVLKMRENVCMLECLVADDESKSAGQEDVSFFKYLGAREFGIFNKDYKTDKRIDYKSFFNRGYTMLKDEMNYFMDCSFYIYSLKQSMYSIMQEKLGCKILGNCILHVPEGGKQKYIKTLYYRKHALKVLEKRINFLEKNN